MAPLSNARHEAFCLALFEGASADEAYVKAGYSKNRGNASRLKANEVVLARLSELQAEAAASSKVTVESICRELDEAVAVAKTKGQAQAMVSVATLRAKLAGLMVERVEVGGPGDFDDCLSTAQIVDRVLARAIEQFRPVDEKDRQGLIEMYERHFQETQEYLDAIRARPIVAERIDPRDLSTPWQKIKSHPSANRPPTRQNGSGH
jgi:phage terminase small subunit